MMLILSKYVVNQKKNELNKNIYLKRMIQHKIELKTFEGFDWASQSRKVL